MSLEEKVAMGRAVRAFPSRPFSAASRFSETGQIRVNTYAIRPTSAFPPVDSLMQRSTSPTMSPTRSLSRPSSPGLRTGGRHSAERAYVRGGRAFRAESFGELNRLRPASATQLYASSSSSSFGSLRSYGAPKGPPSPVWRCGVAREPVFAAVPRHNVLSCHRVATTTGFAPLGL